MICHEPALINSIDYLASNSRENCTLGKMLKFFVDKTIGLCYCIKIKRTYIDKCSHTCQNDTVRLEVNEKDSTPT